MHRFASCIRQGVMIRGFRRLRMNIKGLQRQEELETIERNHDNFVRSQTDEMDELRDAMKVTKTHLQEARDWTAEHNMEIAQERGRLRLAESEALRALEMEQEKLRVAKLELEMARRAESAIGIRRRKAFLILDRIARRLFRDKKSEIWRHWSCLTNRVESLSRVIRSVRRRYLRKTWSRMIRLNGDCLNEESCVAVIVAKKASEFALKTAERVQSVVLKRLLVLKRLDMSCQTRYLYMAFSSWYVEAIGSLFRSHSRHTHTHTHT
jgi:hypothetical protein